MQIHSLAWDYPVVPAPSVEDTIVSLFNGSGMSKTISHGGVSLLLDSQFYLVNL